MKSKTFKQFYLYEASFKISKLSEDDDKPKHKHKEDTDDKSEKKEDLDDKADKKNEDPDRQGIIRNIDQAHLIYKRQDTDGSYTELWTYDISKSERDEFDIRSAILAGTDINHRTGVSDNEQQKFTLWTCGNRQFMEIIGLDN
jgi:hypothetical protein